VHVGGKVRRETTYERKYRSFETRESQLKICDFSGETLKGFEAL